MLQTMDKIIDLCLRLPCTPQQAFALFTHPHLLESWLAKKAVVEPLTGGKYELFWEPETPAHNSTLGCRITAIKPCHFLSFEWRSPKQYAQFANQADPLTHVVVFFIPEAEATEMHLIHSGWRHSDAWEEARQWQEQAWKIALQALEEYVKTDVEHAPA